MAVAVSSRGGAHMCLAPALIFRSCLISLMIHFRSLLVHLWRDGVIIERYSKHLNYSSKPAKPLQYPSIKTLVN